MPSEKSLTINFSDEGTVFVEREPTAVATAPEREIRQLRVRINNTMARNRDDHPISCVQMSKYWKAEAAKQEEYVALGTCALDRLRGENEVLNARICDFQEVSILLALGRKPSDQ